MKKEFIAGLFLSMLVLFNGLTFAKSTKNENSGVRGVKIVVLNDKKIVVENKKGEKVSIELNNQTKYYKNRKAISFSDIAVNDKVSIKYLVGENDTKLASRVTVWKKGGSAKRLSSCNVISVSKSANTLKVKDKNGIDHEIVLDEKTKIKRKKDIIDLADIKVGDRITIYYKKNKKKGEIVSTIKVLKKVASKKK